MKHNIPTQHNDNKLKSTLNGYPSVVPSSGEQAIHQASTESIIPVSLIKNDAKQGTFSSLKVENLDNGMH